MDNTNMDRNNNLNEMDSDRMTDNLNETAGVGSMDEPDEMEETIVVDTIGSEESSNMKRDASDSVYSYSYLNQENQERNPNYYEKKEEESYQTSYNGSSSGSAERTYTAGGEQGQFYQNGQDASSGKAYNSGNTYQSGQTYGNGNAYGGGFQYQNGQPYQNGQAQGQWNSAGNQARANSKKKQKKQKAPKEKKQHGFGMTVVKCASLALVFGLVSSTVFYGTGLAFKYTTGSNDTKTESVQEQDGGKQEKITDNKGSLPATSVSTASAVTDVSDIVDNVMPSIVSITNMGQEEYGDFFGRRIVQDTESAGSGIIIGQTEEEIYIATNNHVVANSNQLTVNFIDDKTVTAVIKGTDSSTDLAVISVAVKDIPSETLEKIKVATLGSSSDIKVGQSAVAIGNALGYGQSVTTGVISAVDREVTVEDETGTAITNDLIQTDAAINPGNSGGALLNMNGEVIGINSVKYSDTQVEGMGYAIPISAAEPIINNLITREVVDESNSSYLGVSGQDVTSDLAMNFGMPEGLYVTLVKENSAAAQAGIKKGDVITQFDGRDVKSMDSLQEIMQYYAAGTEVEITIQTNQNGEWQEQKLSVKLGRKNE